MHQLCAAIDATKAPHGQFHNPDSVRICYACLLPGESPNNFGIFSAEENRLSKKAKIGEDSLSQAVGISDEKEVATTMADLDMATLSKPHPTIMDLVLSNKVCSPQVSKKAIWWRLFHSWNMNDFGDGIEQPQAYCNICGKVIKLHRVDRSPTPLKRHLKTHHDEIFKVLNEEKLKDTPHTAVSPGRLAKPGYYVSRLGRRGTNRMSQLKAITLWIVESDMPPEVVESNSFRKMCSVINGTARHFNVFDKKTIVEYMHYLSSEMRHKMKDVLSNQSLVHVQEYWTTSSRCSYQVDRVNWIDDEFQLKSLAVACDFDVTLASGKETVDKLWEAIGVSVKKQIPVTISTCKDAEAYNGIGGPLLYHGVEFELNPIAEIVYAAFGSNAKAAVEKARALVEDVLSSPSASEYLLKAQQELTTFFPVEHAPIQLISDKLPQYWWSTNEMIGRLIYLRKALEYVTLDSRFEEDFELLNKQDWENLEKIHQTWEPLSIAPQLLQKQELATVGLVPMIFQIVGEDLDPTVYQGKMKMCMTKMLSSFEGRFGKDFPSEPFRGVSKIIWIAHALDPRFKSLDVLGSTETSKDVIFEAVLEEMVTLKSQEKGLEIDNNDGDVPEDDSTEKSHTGKQNTCDSSSAALRALVSSRMSGTKRGLNRLAERLSSSSAMSKKSSGDATERGKVKDECDTELKTYRNSVGMKLWIEHDDGTKDFQDPLPWWAEHYEQFPTLWKLARRYLPIPATCSSPERAFDAEAHNELIKRCQRQLCTTRDTKLLKENLLMVDAFDDEPKKVPGED